MTFGAKSMATKQKIRIVYVTSSKYKKAGECVFRRALHDE